MPCSHLIPRILSALGTCLLIFSQVSEAKPMDSPFAVYNRLAKTYLRCSNEPPPPESAFPERYGDQPWSAYFPTLSALCGTAGVNGVPLDIGCRCTARTPGTRPNCLLGTRSIILSPWDRQTALQLHHRFSDLCSRKCHCEAEVKDSTDEEDEPAGRVEVGGWIGRGGRGGSSSASSQGSDASDFLMLGDYDFSVCGGSCKSPRDCGSPGKQHAGGSGACKCVAAPSASKLELGLSHTLFFGATCLASSAFRRANGGLLKSAGGTAGGIGGRSVDAGPGSPGLSGLSCPCNSSYVSDSCCDSSDGMVWVSLELKRGVLYASEDSI